MPTMNDLYDPDADAVHDRHAAERARLRTLLFGAGPCVLTGVAQAEARAAFDAHHRACLETFETRHATVQEYARWRFSLWMEGPAPEVDWEALGSVAEVNRLAARLEDEAREARHVETASLPVGQPAGLAAFSDAGRVLRFWRHFSPRELDPEDWSVGGGGCRALVTVDHVDGVWHVCFMQDWSHVGVSVTNAIEELAGAVYREALAQAELRRASRRGVRGWLGRRVPAWMRGRLVSPRSFRFYEHLPPRSPMSEDFDRVLLDFAGGRFEDPRWEHHASIPRVIALARRELRHDVEVRPAWLRASFGLEQRAAGLPSPPAR